MFEIRTINIGVDLFGILICLTVIMCRNFIVGDGYRKMRTIFTLLVFCESIVLFSSAMIGILTGRNGEYVKTLMILFSFLRYLFDYILLGLFTEYLLLCFKYDRGRAVRIFLWSIIIFSIIGLLVNLFAPIYYTVDPDNEFVRGSAFRVSQLPYLLICLGDLVFVTAHRKNVSRFVFINSILYIITPIAALIIQMFFVGLDLVNITIIIILMYMFAVMQNQFVKEYVRQTRRLQESRTRLMMSQIKPHFLFNSLTSIAQLCDDEPAAAKSATIAFANYLRGNLSSIEETSPIPFADELVHIKNYMQIERMRFSELLNVEYDIQTDDFKVPALSVQPLIENAVKHGVGMKEDGGTVKLSVSKAEGGIILEIVDDGVGFDTGMIGDSREHVGIKNSKDRLKELCNASLTIESTVGKGTRVTIFIPYEKEK